MNERDPLVRDGTPWEEHRASGRTVFVKREDLCARIGPPFSKMRGLVAFARACDESVLAALDSYHSQAGWALACACRALGRRAVVFYPEVKGEPGWRKSQQEAAKEGAEIVALPATRSSVLWYQARRRLAETHPGARLIPNGLVLEESVAATARELLDFTPAELLVPSATWVVSVSSGNIAAGVARGLVRALFRGRLVLHLGYARDEERLLDDLGRRSCGDAEFPFPFRLEFVNEGYAYRDSVDCPCPFPSNAYYDRKAWKWIDGVGAGALDSADPLVFWNIGD
jgi:hypothetical protein